MYLEELDAAFVIDTFLLLLTGIGPKIALVPFLGVTQHPVPAAAAGQQRSRARRSPRAASWRRPR